MSSIKKVATFVGLPKDVEACSSKALKILHEIRSLVHVLNILRRSKRKTLRHTKNRVKFVALKSHPLHVRVNNLLKIGQEFLWPS